MIGVLDYGQGNLFNARNGLLRAGAKRVGVVKTSRGILESDALVIPGVGSFSTAMARLAPLREAILEFSLQKRPLLGICLGMQVLFEEGLEGGRTKGLGLLRGTVRKLVGAPRLPHVGWNTVLAIGEGRLFAGIRNNPQFYFVHSYAAAGVGENAISGMTEYGRPFVSAVESGNVFGVQFHPEKSAGAGARVLGNFVDLAKREMG
ncbi:MAG: imidazole glycerol phosphate synthase subunit HisH [Candidatus Micrarchaeota archaeon]